VNFDDYSFDLLVEMRRVAVQERERTAALVWDVERELRDRMLTDQATERHSNGSVVRLEYETLWDEESLTPLLECDELPAAVLKRAYIPESQKAIPAHWDKRVVKTLYKYGRRSAAIVERAQRRSRDPKVIVEKAKVIEKATANGV
jgi:hypothetical protein